MYKIVVGQWGISSVDFKQMHPAEFWLLLEAKQPPKMIGSITADEMSQLYKDTYGEDRDFNG
jgi:hypothetical protein